VRAVFKESKKYIITFKSTMLLLCICTLLGGCSFGGKVHENSDVSALTQPVKPTEIPVETNTDASVDTNIDAAADIKTDISDNALDEEKEAEITVALSGTPQERVAVEINEDIDDNGIMDTVQTSNEMMTLNRLSVFFSTEN
jgi:hypothetical protein